LERGIICGAFLLFASSFCLEAYVWRLASALTEDRAFPSENTQREDLEEHNGLCGTKWESTASAPLRITALGPRDVARPQGASVGQLTYYQTATLMAPRPLGLLTISIRGHQGDHLFESGPACSGWVRSGKMDNVRIAQNTYHSLVCDVCEIMIGAPVCVVGLGTFSQSSGAPDGHHLLD